MDIMSVALNIKEVGSAAVKAALDNVRTATKGLGAEFAKLDNATDGLGNALKGLAASAAVATALGKIATESSNAQQAQAQLAAVLKSTNAASGQTIDTLNAHAESLAQLTAFEDDAITSAQTLLLSFNKIAGDTFPRATEAVLDLASMMAAGTGGVPDLKGAAIQVGKALQDPVLGVTALSRAGITFSEVQKETIKQLVDQNRLYDAQQIVLGELAVQTEGQARAVRNTLGGALRGLQNDFGNLFELTRTESQPVIAAIQALSQVLQDIGPVMSRLVANNIPALVGAVGGLTAAFVTYTGIVKGAALTTALLGATETVMGLIALAKGVKSVADAAALLNIAISAGGGAKLLVTIAALGAGFGAYKLIASEVESSINAMSTSMQQTSVTQQQSRAFMDRLTGSTFLGAQAFGNYSDAALKAGQTVARVFGGTPRTAPPPTANLTETGADAEFDRWFADYQEKQRIMARDALAQRNVANVTREPARVPPLDFTLTDTQRVAMAKQVDDSMATANRIVNRSTADAMINVRKTFADGFGSALGAGIAAGFDVALSTKSIGQGFRALAGTVLSSFGGMLVQFGTQALIASGAIQKMFSFLFTPGPQSAIAAAAIIAIGASLQAAGRGILSGGGNKSNVSVPTAGTSMGMVGSGAPGSLPGLSYMPTTAGGMGARVAAAAPVNVTVIGPNDPSAQRAIQELIINANRRGSVFAV